MMSFERAVIEAIEAGRWVVVESKGKRMVAWANSVRADEKALAASVGIAYVRGVLARREHLPMRIKHRAQRKVLAGQ